MRIINCPDLRRKLILLQYEEGDLTDVDVKALTGMTPAQLARELWFSDEAKTILDIEAPTR